MAETTTPLVTPPAPTVFAPPGAPNGWYFSAEDLLRLTVYNSAAGVTVQLRGRFLALGDRTARDIVRDLTPATDRSASTFTIAMQEGWLLDAQVVVSAGTPKRGQTFARLSMVRGNASSGYEISFIAANYVTVGERASFPNSLLVGPLDGPGCLRSITGTDPGAQVEISETVPTGARWRFIALRATLVSDGTAASRVPVLTFDDGTNGYAGAAGNFNQAASLSFLYHFCQVGVSHAQTSAAVLVSTPANIFMAAGHRIRTITGALQVTDNWGAPQYLVEEWIEP